MFRIRDGYGGGWLPVFCKYAEEDMTEMEEILDTYERKVDQSHKYHQRVVWPQIHESIREMRKVIPETQRFEMRRRYLVDVLAKKRKQYAQTPTNRLAKEINKLLLEIKIFNGKIKGITPEMIMRAREYPITKLIKHTNYMAQCPFHNDKTPSLNIRNNYFYCHGCSAHGDVIDIVMRKYGVDFKSAVSKLV